MKRFQIVMCRAWIFSGLGRAWALIFFPTGGPGSGLHFIYRARAGLGLTIFQTRAGFRALGLFQIALNLLNLKYKQEKPWKTTKF